MSNFKTTSTRFGLTRSDCERGIHRNPKLNGEEWTWDLFSTPQVAHYTYYNSIPWRIGFLTPKGCFDPCEFIRLGLKAVSVKPLKTFDISTSLFEAPNEAQAEKEADATSQEGDRPAQEKAEGGSEEAEDQGQVLWQDRVELGWTNIETVAQQLRGKILKAVSAADGIWLLLQHTHLNFAMSCLRCGSPNTRA